jgi:hypothetical protein
MGVSTHLSVAERLGLGAAYQPWLDTLQAAGPPPGGVPLPHGDAAAALLDRLKVAAPDRAALLDALPAPERQPELWWLLERAYHRLRSGIGQPDAAAGPWPSLPSSLGIQGRCFWVFVLLAATGDIRAWHQARSVPDAVSWATLADLGRHLARYRRRHGVTGIDSQFWLSLHFRGLLYALGWLQFVPYRLLTGPGGPLFWYDAAKIETLGSGFRAGDPALSLHVPEDGPLTPAACGESFQAARAFFAGHFPEHAPQVVTCTSWLLDGQLARYLPPESNIVRFQRRFEMVPGARDSDDEVFTYVFGTVPETLDSRTPRTQLEHAVLHHVRAGGHWQVRTGWLDLSRAA